MSVKRHGSGIIIVHGLSIFETCSYTHDMLEIPDIFKIYKCILESAYAMFSLHISLTVISTQEIPPDVISSPASTLISFNMRFLVWLQTPCNSNMYHLKYELTSGCLYCIHLCRVFHLNNSISSQTNTYIPSFLKKTPINFHFHCSACA